MLYYMLQVVAGSSPPPRLASYSHRRSRSSKWTSTLTVTVSRSNTSPQPPTCLVRLCHLQKNQPRRIRAERNRHRALGQVSSAYSVAQCMYLHPLLGKGSFVREAKSSRRPCIRWLRTPRLCCCHAHPNHHTPMPSQDNESPWHFACSPQEKYPHPVDQYILCGRSTTFCRPTSFRSFRTVLKCVIIIFDCTAFACWKRTIVVESQTSSIGLPLS